MNGCSSSILEAAWFTGTWIGGTTLLGKKTVVQSVHSCISFSTHVSSIHTYLYCVTFLYLSATFFYTSFTQSVTHLLTHSFTCSLISSFISHTFLSISQSHFFYGSKASGQIRITFSGSQRTF